MTKLIVHSGAYKTGSTSIQQFLKREAPRLLATSGILYPTAARGGRAQHNNLAAELKGQQSFDPALGGWTDVIVEARRSGAGTVIVSSEHFSTLVLQDIQELEARLRGSGMEPTWIHYVREQASLLNALYVERIVTMRPEFLPLIARPFEEFADWSPIPLGFLDYDSYESSITAGLPGAEVVMRPFVRAALRGGDVIDDFCALVGADRPSDFDVRKNVGAGWRTVEVARRLTHIVAESPISRPSNTPADFQARLVRIGKVRSRLMEITNDLGWNSESAIYATEEFARSTARRYAAANARLGDRIGIDLIGLFGASPPPRRNIGEFSDIAADELFTVVQHVAPALFGATPVPDGTISVHTNHRRMDSSSAMAPLRRLPQRLIAAIRRSRPVDDGVRPTG